MAHKNPSDILGDEKNEFLSFVLLCFGMIYSIVYGVDAYYQHKFAQAVQFMGNGDYPAAEGLFNSHKNYDKNEITIYYNLALIYLNTGRDHLAKLELITLLQIDPNDLDAKQLQTEISNKK